MSVLTELPDCLLCGPGPDYRAMHDGLLRCCTACGFVWTAEGGEPPSELYDGDYFVGDGYENYFVLAPRRFEAAQRVRWLRSVVSPGSLVEAGAAGGFFVEAARRVGISASGVEVSEVAARFARERLGVPVRQGCFEAGGPEGPVDAVCAFHVLEHVEDPRVFLGAARAALRPGGWLLLEVPNIVSAAARRLGTAWSGLQPEYHRWHFSPESLVRLVQRAGFDVVRQDTTFFRYYMPTRYRIRHARHQLLTDWRRSGSLRLVHPRHGDLLRLVARLPRPGQGPR